MIFVYIKKIDNKRSGDTVKAKKNCRYHRCHLRCFNIMSDIVTDLYISITLNKVNISFIFKKHDL